ncbi:MAG: DUF1553 domain-containing protein, partial [Planctomycetales bacterium]|nr:DUF1553 domain-containing protein [Planctomycetales bacterium]
TDGVGFRTTISKEALEGLSRKDTAWIPSPEDQQRRRSLYLYAKRGLLPPMMTTFDRCDSTQSCGQRDQTTVPTQALAMLNNPFVHDRSRLLAATVAQQYESPTERIKAIWSHVYRRAPTEHELPLALKHIDRQQARIEDERAKREMESKTTSSESENKTVSDGLIPVLRLRADQGVSLDESGCVQQWKDISSHGHDAYQPTPTHRPTVDASLFLGQPAIRFDGNQRFMNLSGSLLSGQTFTFIAVASDFVGGSDPAAGHRELISNWNGSAGNSTTSLFLGLTARNSVRLSDARLIPDASDFGREPFILCASNGQGHSNVRINGRSVFDGGPLPPRNLTTSWVIGQQGNIDGEYWNGYIAELIVYPDELPEDKLCEIETQLSQRYGIGLADREVESAQLDSDVHALASLVHVLFNSNEFLYVD